MAWMNVQFVLLEHSYKWGPYFSDNCSSNGGTHIGWEMEQSSSLKIFSNLVWNINYLLWWPALFVCLFVFLGGLSLQLNNLDHQNGDRTCMACLVDWSSLGLYMFLWKILGSKCTGQAPTVSLRTPKSWDGRKKAGAIAEDALGNCW